MILWINGAFGAGKTTVAGLVTKRLGAPRSSTPSTSDTW